MTREGVESSSMGIRSIGIEGSKIRKRETTPDRPEGRKGKRVRRENPWGSIPVWLFRDLGRSDLTDDHVNLVGPFRDLSHTTRSLPGGTNQVPVRKQARPLETLPSDRFHRRGKGRDQPRQRYEG